MRRSGRDHPKVDHRVAKAISDLRASVRGALDQIAPSGAVGARSISRLLGISRSTAWRCWRIAYSSEFATVLAVLPGERGMRTMLERLRDAGVDRSGTTSIESSWSALLELMREARLDHGSIRALTTAIGDSAFSDIVAARLRRSAFRGNTGIYGIRARLCLAAQLFVPAGDSLDLAAMLLHEEVAPLRPLEPLRIHTGIAPGPGPLSQSGGRPFSENPQEAPLVAETCTPGSIGRSIVVSPEFPGEVDLHPNAIEGGSVRVAIGETLHAIGSARATILPDGTLDDEAFMSVPIGLPTETLVMLVGIHRSLPAWSDFRLTARTAIAFATPMDARGHGTSVPIDGSIESTPVPHLSPGSEETAEAALRLLDRGAKVLAASIGDFRFVRATIRYPLLMSAIALRWRLPSP